MFLFGVTSEGVCCSCPRIRVPDIAGNIAPVRVFTMMSSRCAFAASDTGIGATGRRAQIDFDGGRRNL